MKTLFVLSLCVCLLAMGCRSQPPRASHTYKPGPLSIIAAKGTSPTELDAAVANLTMPPKESPKYWSEIANDSSYPVFHRRRAVFQLLSRHLRTGMSVSELAKLLDHPTWLRASHIFLVDTLRGQIPVHLSPNDTVFVLEVLLGPHRDTSAIYLRVRGKVDLQKFRDAILAGKKTSIGNAAIVEIGLEESDPEGRITRTSEAHESGKYWKHEEHY